MNFMHRTPDGRIIIIGFNRINDNEQIRVYTGVEGVIAIRPLPAPEASSIGTTYSGLISPDFKKALLDFIDSKGNDLIHFCYIDGGYYSTDVKVSGIDEAIRLYLTYHSTAELTIRTI